MVMSFVHATLILVVLSFWALVIFIIQTLFFHLMYRISKGKFSDVMAKIQCLMMRGARGSFILFATCLSVLVGAFCIIGAANFVEYLAHSI